MFGVDSIVKFYSMLFLVLLSSSVHSLPLNSLSLGNSNFPRQFVQQPSPLTPSGEITHPEQPSNVNNLPTYYSNSQQSGDTDANSKNPFPYPQRITTPEYYSTSTTAASSTEYYTTTEKYAGSSSTTESNDESNSSAGEEEEQSSSTTTTITPFLNSDLPGFPINPPSTFPGLLPIAGEQLPKPSALLNNYPQQHIDGAVGPFPEKIQEQQVPWGLVGTFGTGVGQLLQRLNPLQLLRPVTDTFQNIGHVLSHPNYGPGSAFLRPIQFWSAVNAVGNPNLVPYRKLPADVAISSDSRKQEIM